MKKSIPGLGLFVLIMALTLVMTGCPQPNVPYSPDRPEMVAVSGTLQYPDPTRALSSRLVLLPETLEGALVIATDTDSGETFTGEVGSDGAFTVQVPKGSARSYIFAVVDADGKTAGVFTFPPSPARGASVPEDVPTGLKAADDVALGSIEVGYSPGAIPVTPDSSDVIDTSVVGKLDPITGELIGFSDKAEYGKGDDTLLGELESPGDFGGAADIDGDGLPNVVDADDDGDGIVDDFDTDMDGDGTEDSYGSMGDVTFTLGYLLDIRGNDSIYDYYSGDTTTIDNALKRDMRIDLRLQFTDEDRFDGVESVRLYLPSSPTYAAELDAVEFNNAEQTFANGTTTTLTNLGSIAWADLNDGTVDESEIPYGYNIPVSDREPDGQLFVVSVKTDTDLFEVGDVFTVEVIYEDGTVEYYSTMINYIYSKVTHFSEYAMDTSETVAPAAGDLIDFGLEEGLAIGALEIHYTDPADYVWFTFVPPQDEDGNYIIPYEDPDDPGSYLMDSGFRIELHEGPSIVARGMWQDERRYDGYLSELTAYGTELGGDLRYGASVPVQYLIGLIDTEDDDTSNDLFDMEYFLNLTEDSYIKNRLQFKLVFDDL